MTLLFDSFTLMSFQTCFFSVETPNEKYKNQNDSDHDFPAPKRQIKYNKSPMKAVMISYHMNNKSNGLLLLIYIFFGA